MRRLWLLGLALLPGCTTYHDVSDIKYVGFSDEANHGKPVGQIEGNDCVYRLFGYNLGSPPSISAAIANVRTGRTAQVSDIVSNNDAGAAKVRYVDHMTVTPSGFNAVIFGKSCIDVKGEGYL